MVANDRPKQVKPKREIRKVFASVKQVMRVHHVIDNESIWIWGKPAVAFLPRAFSVCVWNLWKQSGGQPFAEEFLTLSSKSDLFLGQEALVSRDAIALFAQPEFEVIHAATYRRLDGCRDGVMTLARAAVCAPPVRIVSATVEPLLKTTKAALVTKYRVGSLEGPVLAVVNLHSTLIRSPKTAAREVFRILEGLENHDGPVLFAGDFNTFSKAYFREMERALGVLGMTHVCPEFDPRTKLAQLDQVFVRGLTVKSFHINTSIRHSDHFPMICDVELAF